MANSSKKIIRGVRVGSKTYTAGMEDELDIALSAAELQRLSDKGHIEGKWSGKAAELEAAQVEAEKPEKAGDKTAKKEK
jgi:hypothetical protein